MLIGYARVSTLDQNPNHQIDALNEAGCKKIFTEKISGAGKQRTQLQAALDYMREGDTFVVWKLSRLARSLTQIISTLKILEEKKNRLACNYPKYRYFNSRRKTFLSYECSIRSVSARDYCRKYQNRLKICP